MYDNMRLMIMKQSYMLSEYVIQNIVNNRQMILVEAQSAWTVLVRVLLYCTEL